MTTDRPQDGLKTFKFLSDAKAWLAEHGMALHEVTQVRRIYTYANADLSVWVEITMGDCVAVAPIKRPVEVEEVAELAPVAASNRDATFAQIAADLDLCDVGLALTKGATCRKFVKHRKACMAAIKAMNVEDGLDKLSDDELLTELTT